MFEGLISIDNIPTLDLHGETGDISRIYINEFIKDNMKLKNKFIAIVHGKGTGVLKQVTASTLKVNKDVLEYKICYFNEGVTIAKLNTP